MPTWPVWVVATLIFPMATACAGGEPADSAQVITQTIGTVAVAEADTAPGASTTEAEAPAAEPFAHLWPPAVGLGRSWAPDPDEVSGLSRLARAGEGRFVVHTAGGEVDFLPGVNLGPTVPGHHPGEVAVAAEDYRRWFPRIAGLGLRTVRVYTIQRPVFYDELAAYNHAHPDAPLYLVHGVWIPEERFLETGDLWHPEVVDEMRTEIDRAVAVVHGDADLPERRGHASGRYTADVTPWLAGWVLGIEMDPAATAASDASNAGLAPHRGEYVQAVDGASPTEVWLGAMLDHLATGLAGREITMPLAFANWPTTDPLHHPDEPLESEDLVGIDASALVATDAWPGGLFASYHAYPYYPDFLRYQPDYTAYEHDGAGDAYAGYLAALRDHHGAMPTLVTEFGVPSSLGSAHLGTRGRDQGDHEESEAIAIDADLLATIHDLGLGGGFIFEWTDEWFKLTWNTMDLEAPAERRPLWHNQWTNEQVFGLVAVEPGAAGPEVVVDGDAVEWGVPTTVTGPTVAIRHDAAWLYLLVTGTGDDPFTLAAATIGAGGGDLPDGSAVDHPVDVAVDFPAGTGAATAWIRTANDPVSAIYEVMFDPTGPVPGDDWVAQRLVVNRPLTVPTTGEEHAMEVQDVGSLRHGTADPTHPDFDSHTVWSRGDDAVEIRLPWMLLGISDPSSLQAWRIGDGEITATSIDELTVSVVTSRGAATDGYTWEGWNAVAWHERPKHGLTQLTDAIRIILNEESP